VRAVVLEAPLLFENRLKDECDWVILVVAELAVRQARVGKSRSWGPEELIRREKFFWPVYLKRALADATIFNNSTVEDCRRQVENIFSRLISSDNGKLA